MSNLTITYQCCNGSYSLPIGPMPPADLVPLLDRLHAAEHPECPPLDAPLPAGEPNR